MNKYIFLDGSILNTPLTITETGELVQHAVIQYVAPSEQENIDPQNTEQVETGSCHTINMYFSFLNNFFIYPEKNALTNLNLYYFFFIN